MNADRICCFLLTTSLTLGGSCAYAQLEGTLFTSPEQRAYLDYLRQDFLARSRERGFDITETEIPEIPVIGGEGQPAAEEVTYTLGGIVSLRDGTQRIWLNGQALSEKELPTGVRLVQENGIPALRFSTDSGNSVLLPGQTLQLEAGSVLENFEYRARAQEISETAASLSLPAAEAALTSAQNETSPAATIDPVPALASDTSLATPADDLPELSAEQVVELLQVLEQQQAEASNE